MDIITYIISALLILLVGYSVGRRVGNKQGYKKGKKHTPVELRREVLKSGKCPICDKSIEE